MMGVLKSQLSQLSVNFTGSGISFKMRYFSAES